MSSITHILEIQRKKSPPTPRHTTGGDREVNRGEAPDRGEHRERDPRGCGSTERIKAGREAATGFPEEAIFERNTEE